MSHGGGALLLQCKGHTSPLQAASQLQHVSTYWEVGGAPSTKGDGAADRAVVFSILSACAVGMEVNAL